jgi:DNA-binding beta-propeller fold protein YncE
MIAMPPPPPVNGYLYAQTNDIRPGRNEVVPYAIGRRGQLTPVPGGRVRTGGTGISDQTAGKSQAENADPSIAATADGRFLYAVNGGSDTVAGFRVQGNGALTPLPGSPYPSRGVNPVSVSIGADGHTVIVGNRNEDPLRLALLRGAARPTVVAFRINDDGALRPTGAAVYTAGGLPVEAVQLPFASSIVFSVANRADTEGVGPPNGGRWATADAVAASMQTFRLRPQGGLSPLMPWYLSQNDGMTNAANPADTTQSQTVLGVATHPRLRLMYLGAPGAHAVTAVSYTASGSLRSLALGADSGRAPCWMRTSPDGRYLYVLNAHGYVVDGVQQGPSVSTFDLRGGRAYAPVETSRLQLPSLGVPYANDQGVMREGNNGVRITVSPDGTYVWVLTARDNQSPTNADHEGNAIYGMRVGAEGALALVTTRNLLNDGFPWNSRAFGLAVVQPGKAGTAGP